MKEAVVQSSQSLLSRSEKSFDVIVIGSGPGGGMAAWRAAQRGKKVAVLEMGPGLRTRDFEMDERKAYQNLYQEAAGRTTLGGEITILQGRTLGGGSAINWTSSFETPEFTLKEWQDRYGLKNLTTENLRNHFDTVKELIGVAKWELSPNRNNEILAEGLKKLGVSYNVIPRNVRGCQNLGYCGMGCPVGAKQSSFRTSLARACELGAEVFCDIFVTRLILNKKEVTGVEIEVGGQKGLKQKIVLKGKEFVCAAGAIGTPALLLRSQAEDPFGLLGSRTFLHPTTICGAHFKEKVEPFYGAPQTIYSDAFIPKTSQENKAGYKLEVPPIHPILLATSLPLRGELHRSFMEELDHKQAIIALQRDGFHKESSGGQVILKKGHAALDYQITPYQEEAFRRSILTMGEVQFAAGAQMVFPVHRQAAPTKSWQTFKKQVADLPMRPLDLKIVSAHVMGGCRMGDNPQTSVTDLQGRYHHLENLKVRDGSLFPTSLGTNPMLTVLTLVDYLESGQGA